MSDINLKDSSGAPRKFDLGGNDTDGLTAPQVGAENATAPDRASLIAGKEGGLLKAIEIIAGFLKVACGQDSGGNAKPLECDDSGAPYVIIKDVTSESGLKVSVTDSPSLVISSMPAVDIAANQQVNIGTMPQTVIAAGQNVGITGQPTVKDGGWDGIASRVCDEASDARSTAAAVFLTPTAPDTSGNGFEVIDLALAFDVPSGVGEVKVSVVEETTGSLLFLPFWVKEGHSGPIFLPRRALARTLTGDKRIRVITETPTTDVAVPLSWQIHYQEVSLS